MALNHCAISNSTLDGITGLIGSFGTARFSNRLFAFFNALVPIDHCSVFTVAVDSDPKTLFAEGLDASTGQMALDLAETYVDGHYVNDPFIHNDTIARKLESHGRPIVSSFIPRTMPLTDYRRRFYDVPAITHEVNIVGVEDNTRFYASLYRTTQPHFTRTEVSSIEFYSSVAISAMHRHIALPSDNAQPISKPNALSVKERERLLTKIRTDLQNSGPLSPREAEVCAHIVLGYSNAAISFNLGITPNTASTHRKRAYAKLGICSQAELFARYVDYARELRH